MRRSRAARGLVPVVLGTMVLATCSSESAPRESAARAPLTSERTEARTREAWLWPFAAQSPWNAGVGSGAVFQAEAGPLTSALISRAAKAWFNGQSYSHPIYRASKGDPMATVRQDGRPDEKYRIPDEAMPAEGRDRHLHVVDPSGRWVDETWHMEGANPMWTTDYHVRVNLRGTGFGAGTRASAASGMGGLIRKWELEAGEIRHALALAITASQLSRDFTWPATRTDGGVAHNTGPVPMGTYAAIPPTVNIDTLGLSSEGKVIGLAMQRYGVYVVDRTSDVFALYTEPTVSGSILSKLRSDLDALRRHVRVVTNNGPSTVNGGGTRAVPAAPAFAS